MLLVVFGSFIGTRLFLLAVELLITTAVSLLNDLGDTAFDDVRLHGGL